MVMVAGRRWFVEKDKRIGGNEVQRLAETGKVGNVWRGSRVSRPAAEYSYSTTEHHETAEHPVGCAAASACHRRGRQAAGTGAYLEALAGGSGWPETSLSPEARRREQTEQTARYECTHDGHEARWITNPPPHPGS